MSVQSPTFESRMLIDGKLVDGEAGTFANINPATEAVIGEVTDASAADVDRAIDAARRAFDETSWSTDHAFRQRCLLQLQDALEREQELLREELILEVGCPRMVTHGPQLDAPLSDALRYPAKLIDEYPWQVDLGDAMVELTGQMTSRAVWREPVGVVAAIVPWNYPVEVMLHKVGQALATGNTMVVKPAPQTPFNATRLGRLIAEQTDIPAGVVNVVTPSDNVVAEELVLSPKVDLISFTGSTAVGRRIMEKGAATMKRLFLELGGKSAAIVLDDADLEGREPHRHGRLHARRAGLRDADSDVAAAVALRRGRRVPGGAVRFRSRSAIPSCPTRSAVRSSPPRSATASWATSAPGSSKAPPR